jgi:6-phosphofructokinase 1
MQKITVDTLGPAARPTTLKNRAFYVQSNQWVRHCVDVIDDAVSPDEMLFEKAGPREKIFFDPAQSRAAIVTCGGLAPGLNNVIRSLVMELHYHYGVPSIWGIPKGFKGLNPAAGLAPLELTPDLVDDIHTEGGTILGSSRGRQDTNVMLDYMVEHGINQLYCIGGDGTMRAATEIARLVLERKLHIAIVGIPKTIDNDVFYCDRTFGFLSAVDEAQDVLEIAHVEAKGAERGIGLVKLMGRDAGFIACGATISSQKVNFTLIPELPFQLAGPNGFLAALERRMDERDHALIAIAEGAGQELFADKDLGEDASGNRRYGNIGLELRDRIRAYFKEIGKPVEVKYIDPSYIVRGIPANSEDGILCDQLARGAVHAAMAGKTACMVSYMNNRLVLVPLHMSVGQKKYVDLNGPLWQSVLAATGQPRTFG